MNTNTRMTRSASDKVIGGVAGGLSQYFGVDPVLIRLGFVFMTLASGLGLVLYAALWLVLPVTGGRAIFEQAVQGVQNGVNQVSNAVRLAVGAVGAAALRRRDWSPAGPARPGRLDHRS